MKTNILHNIISSQKNFITRCIALAMVAMVGVGNAWADPIQLSDLVFSTSNTKRIVNEDFSGCSTRDNYATKSENSSLSNYGVFNKIYNNSTSNHYKIENSTFGSGNNALEISMGSGSPCGVAISGLTFGATGAWRVKVTKAAKMYVGIYAAGATSSAYAKASGSVYVQANNGTISISKNTSSGNWQNIGTYTSNTYIDICVIYNNTNDNATYGNSISLAGKTAHVYIDGTCVMNGDNPKAFTLSGLTLSAFRVYPIATSGNKASVDDIQIWNELPGYDNSCAAPMAVASSSPTNTGATLTVTDANNVNKYDFCCNTSSSASKSVTASVSGGKSKAITGLNYGTKYYYWARTDCGSSSYSTWYPSSDPSYFTTTCPNPTSISTGSITKTGVTFTIVDENSPALSTYGIYYSTNSTAPTSGTSATTTSTSTSKSVTGLTAGTKYYYWVRGQGPDANSTTWVSGGNFTTLHEYTLTYKETDGTGNGSGKVDENATSFTNTTAPSKDGYRLEGFYTSSGLSTKVASNARAFVANIDGWTGAGGAYTKGSNADLYLKWDANTYTVTFDKNGGGTGTGTADQDFTYGVAQNLRACGFTAPTDKYFLGWNTNKNATTALYTDGESVSNLTTTHEGTVTLYAIWKDYSFTNYRTSCCTPWDDPTWSYDTYSLSTGGSGATKTLSGTTHGTLSFASSNVSVISVNPSTGAVSPVGAGTAYVIATWESDGTYCEKVMNSSTFTVTGTVTVTFKKNGGTGTDDQTQSITYNTATNLKTISTLGLTAPSCKYFYGWATSQSDADAGTRTYTDGQSVTLEEGVTLYAIWKTTQYTISDGTLSGVDSHSYSATSIDCGTTLTITCAADGTHKGEPTVTATGSHGTISVVSATSVTIADVQSDIAVSISYAAKENYAITWKVAGTALSGAAIASCTNNVLEGGNITALPSAPANNTLAACSANKFMGWAKLNADIVTPMTDADDIAALGLFTTAAGAPEITENTTFYAVFANSTSGTWNMGTITTIEKGATMSYANCNGSHTVTGSDGNDYSYTSYQIMNSSGNQFQSGAGYMYNTTPFPAMTQMFIDGGSNKTGYLSVYESDSEIGSDPGTLVALTGTPSDYNYDYTYTLSGKSYFLLKAGSETIKANEITITFGSATNYVTKCCTPLDEINGDKTGLVYNGVTLTWDDIDHVSSWTVTGVDGSSAAVPAVNIGTPTDGGSTYSCVISNLSQYADYTFTITATPADGYCDASEEVSFKTPCVAPSGLSISATGSKWDFCAGESMTLTVNGANVSASATYQWQKHNGSAWVDIDGANSASYTVASMAASNAGQYRCTVTNPGSSCDATTDGAWVRLWQLYINNGTADAFQSLDFSNTGTGTGSNTSVYLTSDKGYQFKLIDNNGGYFGLNSKTVTTNESNITLNGTGANVNVTSGLEGNYTFAIDYTSKNNPKVSITYPVGNQPAGRKIWFDKSVIPDWNTAGTGNLCWRIGKPSHTLTNQDDIEDVHHNYFSLVPGTDRFYVYETKAYDGFEAWSVANNVAWSGSSTNDPAYDNHGIYTHYHGDGTDVTRSTVYQKYVVGESGVTLVPTTKYGETNWYCDFYSVTKTDGMLKHEATITSYSHGTVTVAYTKYDGTGAASFTSGSNSDLAHRCILTITAVPDPGYNLTSLQVNSANFTSGNEHILSADATITAVFSPKTTTVTFDKNSGTGGDNGVTATYDADMPTVSVPSRSNYNFGGYFDAETDDNGSGTKYYNANGTSAKIWDKEDAALTLYAQWTGDSYTISYKDQNNETYSGSNLASLPTSHTYGAATALVNGVKTGYTFGGWFDNSSCTGAAVTSIGATAITANTTYYAKWTETDYTVTMAQSPAAGASLTGGTTTAHYNGTINISTNVPAGYAFNGWTSSPSVTFADASATSTSFTMPAGDVTITANFLQTHSATFIGPDGSTLQTVNAIEGAAVAYSASTPETCDDGVDPSNYFVGWATNTWSGKVAKGSIVPTFYDIANGDNLPNMGASDVTYYAVFAKRSGTPLTENTYTGDFSSKIFSSSNNTSATVNGISWTLDAYHYDNEWNQVFCTDFSTGNNSRGQKVGSSSNWPAYMSLTTSGISGTITSVAVSTAGNSGVDATVAITVGGNGWKLKNTNNYSASLTNSNTAYEFTGSGTGSISIDWQEDEENYTNALYFSQVVVKYTTGGDVSYSNYMTSCATCVTPSGLAANAITESGATITWSGTSASGTEGFKVAWNTTNSVPSPLTGSNSADVAKNVKTYDITGLNDETTYYVFVQSKCNSEWSSSTNFTTLAIHDITFTKDNGTLSVVSPIGVVHGQTLTFPNVTSTSCGTFVGWKATEVSDYDNAVAPSPLYKYNGTKENITADESYQAVYRTASGAETNVTDNVTVALTGITGTYGAWSDKIAASAATYAGNTAKNSTNQIQMRSSDDSGIISTISGGKLEQVDVTWASNTSGRTVQIYGKATPYSATSDLYSNDDNVKGTLLGELVYTSDGGTSTLEIDGTYNYIGIKSKSGAAYATNIGIQWWGSEAHYMTAPTCNAMVGITASFSSFTYVYGSGPSATQTFIVSGLNLSTNPLVVTAPTNYEISKTVDGTYTSSVSYTPVAGKVSAETVYIRLKGGLSVGTYNYAAASGVSAASEGATTQKVALNGSVTKASGSIAFTSFNAVDHYEAEMPKGGTSLDVTLTVSVTGDGAVSYGRSPAAGSSAVPATTPTTTLHVTTVGTWTVTANLTAGTSYTSASTTCQVVVYYADHYYDNIHSDVQALVDIDMPLERRGSYSAPDLMDSDKSTGSCAATHYKFMGWISKTAIDGGLANDAAYKAALIPAGTAMTATGESYYAVWAELEE